MDMKIYFPGGKKVYADYGEYTIETDQPVRGGGDDSAPAPFDMFLASIGTCAGIFALGFMQQRGIDPTGASIAMSPQFDPEVGLITQDRHRPEAAGGLPGEVQGGRRQRDEPVHGQEAPAPAARVRHHAPRRPDMADQFDPASRKSLEDPARLEALPQSAVVALLKLDGGETVVDYGAGTGIYTIAVAEAVPDGKVFAVEALPHLVELLREKITPELEGRLCICETGDNVVPRRRRRGRPRRDGRRAAPPVRPARGARRGRPRATARAACSSWSTGATRSVRWDRRAATCSACRRSATSSPGWASRWSRPTSPATC